MIAHYLKIGLRNICRYKQQSVVSIAGLAVGFVCFALSLLWVRYEMTYNRIPNSDRIYLCLSHDKYPEFLGGRNYVNLLYGTIWLTKLKEENPEIEACVGILKTDYEEESGIEKKILQVTPGFSDFFGIQFLEGNEEMFFSNPLNVLISEREAKKNFPDKSPLGELMKFSNTRIRGQSFSRDFFAKEYNTSTFYHFDKDYTVNGIVKEFPPHTDFQFDYIIPYRPHDENAIWSFHIFIRLKEGVDCKTLENKWKQEVLSNPPAGAYYIQYHIDTLYPLEKLHYSWSHQLFGQSQNLTLQQILILAGVGLISILCLLFNYLSLFITRLQQKKRELALQIALGASFKQLYAQMSIEFLLILLGAFALGCMAIEILMPYYLDFAGIEEYSYQIWIELIGYFGLIIVISELLLLWPLFYIRRHSLSEAIRGQEGGREKQVISQNSLLVVQLFVGILLLFCTSVFIKQVHYMKQMDIGFNPNRLCFIDIPDRGILRRSFLREEIQPIKRLSEIENVSYSASGKITVNNVPDLAIFNDDRDTLICQGNVVSVSYFDVCGIKCLQGELFRENEPDWNNDKIIINESMAKSLNFDNPIGKSIKSGGESYQIIGIVPDVYVSGLQTRPIIYYYSLECEEILYRYKPGMKRIAEEKVTELLDEIGGYAELGLRFSYMDEQLETEKKEEINFMKLLNILTVVCIIGAMVGIYSMVSLACERRRKEIAIRKINGAGYGTLIKLFLKKYILLLVVACAVAFPTGYLLMKPWLEQFVRRINMDAWIFCSILAAVAVMISGIVIARIWRTLHANPANEIRKE